MSMSYIAWPEKVVCSMRVFSFNRENTRTQLVKNGKPSLITNNKDTFYLRSRAAKT